MIDTQKTLLDVCELIVDCPHTTAQNEGSGIPLIRTPNIGRGYFILEGVHRISDEVYQERIARAEPRAGDIIFAREAPAGNCAIIRSGQKMCLGQRTVLIRPDAKKVDPRYLCYFLLSPKQQHRLLCGATGSTVTHVNMPSIRGLKIDSLPPLPVQRRIAAVLGVLDDAIELNRKMNANLEAQAQALFKSWFVDFAPFGGKMPKEWKMGTLGEVAVYYDGSISVGELSSRNYFSTENMVANKGGVVDASSVPQEGSVPECVEGCVLVSNIRPYFKKIHRVLSRGGHSNDVLCFKAKDRQYEWFLYQLLFEDAFFDHMMSGAKGTKMPRGDKRQILSYPCRLPSKEDAEEFGKQVSPLCRMIAANAAESRKLAETRDALLPKLMSGEAEVG